MTCTVALIPAYNPSESLITLVHELLEKEIRCVVVDDGSGQSYEGIFASLDPGTTVLHQVPNQGKGAALKRGMRYLQDVYPDAVVVTADADGQHLSEDIVRVSETAALHPGALVLGTRVFEKERVPFRSYYGNKITEAVFRLVSGTHVSDTQTGLRAFHANMIRTMLEADGNRYEYEMNQLLLCAEKGIPMIEVPIHTVYEDGNRSSHFNAFRDSVRIYRNLLAFGISGIVSFVLDYSLFSLLSTLLDGTEGTLAANVLARIVSGTFNYEVNRTAVFHDPASRSKSAFKYLLLAVTILLLNTALLYVLCEAVHMNRFAAKLLTEAILFLFSWVMQKRVVFPGVKGVRMS